MDITDEKLILSNLINNVEYISKVLPFLKEEYFQNIVEQTVFVLIKDYIQTYNTAPNRTTLIHDVHELVVIGGKDTSEAEKFIKEICSLERPTDLNWLVKKTEEFCQNKAVYLAITKAINIYDGTDTTTSSHTIPEIMREAISINFDTQIGMDFYDDAKERYDYYTLEENKIQFLLPVLNEITNGGAGRKTFNLIIGGLHSGKTMVMINLACDYARIGYNVLYISLEMRQEEILMRMDANFLRTQINSLKTLDEDVFIDKIEKIRQKSYGKMKVKDFPTGISHSEHFSHIINELKLKQNFIPDVIFVDYMGIAASSRMKIGSQNSYFYLKSISDELRALAQKTNTVLWTGMQLTRSGITDTDPDVDAIAEAISVLHTADFALSITRTEELDKLGQIMFKQQKNRYGNKANRLRFMVGVDIDKQILYEVNSSEQRDLVDENISTKLITNTSRLKEKFKNLS